MTRALKELKEEDFAECFRAWSKRMQKCINSGGDYFEGDNE